MLCLREGNFSLPFVLSTVLILLWGLLLPWPLVPTAQRQPPLRRQPQSCTGLHSSQEAKAATAEVTSASGICVQAQLLQAGALLLPLARLVIYSQTSLALHISALHLPPAYSPVPVLDHPRESHFSFLPLLALPAEWQHGARSRTHHYLATTQ